MSNKKGFTLIELLVVIAIIGLLSTLAVVSLNNARGKARDAKRISDVKAIQTAIELYKAETNDDISAIITQIKTVDTGWAGISTLLTPYLASGLPTDPGDGTYTICGLGDTYMIHTTLENTPPTPGVQTSGVADGDCIIETSALTDPAACDTTTSYCIGSKTIE